MRAELGDSGIKIPNVSSVIKEDKSLLDLRASLNREGPKEVIECRPLFLLHRGI